MNIVLTWCNIDNNTPLQKPLKEKLKTVVLNTLNEILCFYKGSKTNTAG